MTPTNDKPADIRRELLAMLAALQGKGHSPAAILAVAHAQSLALVLELYGPDAAMHLCQRAAERIRAVSGSGY
jgi:cobalamin biosynthesis protein CbiD